jgi:hypothetical protein
VQFRALLLLHAGLGLTGLTLAGVAHAEEPVLGPSPGADVAPASAAPPPADLPPPGAKTTHIVAGTATTVVAYGLAAGFSFLIPEEDLNGVKDLRIPIAGPWMTLGKTGCPASDTNCSKIPLVLGGMLMIMDGVVQAGGLAVIAEGLFLNTSSRAHAEKKAELRLPPAPHVQAVPFSFEKGGLGLGVVGTF